MKMNMTFLSLALLLVPAAMVAMQGGEPSPSGPMLSLAQGARPGSGVTAESDAAWRDGIIQQLSALSKKLDDINAPKPAAVASTPGAHKLLKLHADSHIRAGIAAGTLVVAAGVFGPQSAKDFVAGLTPDARLVLTAGTLAAGTQLTTGVIDGQWKRLSNITQFLGFTGAAVTTVWAINAALQAGSTVATRLGDRLH